MSKVKLQGPLRKSLVSLVALSSIAVKTYMRHALGKKLEQTWDADTEIGTLFWRRQFTLAMRSLDIKQGRQILDCVQTPTPFAYDVQSFDSIDPPGKWHMPNNRKSGATILYFHGGGYSFHGAMSHRFAEMLASHIGAPLFAPDYRLTPEHPHPAQSEDALSAWQHVTQHEKPENLVVIGDSAGGHMALMLLQSLKTAGLQQPALVIALCAWTDIGDSAGSLQENDKYDLVQGWMALQFGEWLDPENLVGREKLYPVFKDYSTLAPIYMQVGGRDILHDMINEFARKQATLGADIMLDVWPNMMHDFQLMDALRPESIEAIERIKAVIGKCTNQQAPFAPNEKTRVASGNYFVN
jgi:epsilon-lactone hydrolase